MTDDQQRARERFEQWCNGRYRLDKRINVIGDVVYADRWTQGAFVGFTAALRAAPEGFVLVPGEPTARPLEEWHDDTTNGGGDSVWFTWDAERGEWLGEPAWIGRPNDSDWPGYHTHWLPHPAFPAMLAARPQGVKDV